MGGKKKKPAAPPPPAVKAAPPPAAEDISEVISPTLRQEAARRARRGAYVTRGQRMGAGGQVLGASPIQLADVATASGMYKSVPKEEKLEKPTGRGIFSKFTRGSFRGSQLQKLKEMGYKPTKYSVKRKRSIFGGHKTKQFEEIKYEDYVRQYNQRAAQRVAQRRKRAEAARTRGGMTI